MMKKGAVMIEVFPYNYYRETYFSLCNRFGIHHFWVQNEQADTSSTIGSTLLPMISTKRCMDDLKCRSFARGMDVSMSHNHLKVVTEAMKKIEQGALGVHNAPR